MSTLQRITRDTWETCLALEVAPDQTAFLPNNAYSLAQAYAKREFVPLAVYADTTMVGFAMYALSPDQRRSWIGRLMIEHQHQEKGYGRAAMEQVIERLNALSEHQDCGVCYAPDNMVARWLYTSLGVEETDRVIDNQTVAMLRFVGG